MPMLSDDSLITFRDTLPEAVDVVIIGAGVIGISTAWFLAKAGVSVLVCEKGRVAGEQSSRNWGWVRTQGRDEAELPIAQKSLELWEGLSEEIEEDTGFTRQGLIFLGENEKDLSEFEEWMEIAKQHQLDTRLLSAAELSSELGYSQDRWKGAMQTPSDARAEPFIAVPAIARAAQRKGVSIIENCAVRVIEKQAGVVSGVVTELGPVKANAVICCGGAWSSPFLANLGIRFPQLLVKGTVVRTTPVAEGYQGGAASHKYSFRRRQDGGYTLSMGNYLDHYVSADSFRYCKDFLPALKMTWSGMRLRFNDGLIDRLFPKRHWLADEITPFERTRVLNPRPNAHVVRALQQLMTNSLPVLANAEIAEAWAGMIDAPPDFVPVMDELPDYKNFFLASGFSGHGFGIGPGAGYVMAKMVQSESIEFDLNRFRFSRFSDGSPIKVGPAL
jgi:glycine/D-amino acid oxidase-like deaminating enzyme